MTGLLISLRYLGNARMTYRGARTKRLYEWQGHGAIQGVTTDDAAALLLMRRRSGGCCGGPKRDAGPLFEEVGDNTEQIATTED